MVDLWVLPDLSGPAGLALVGLGVVGAVCWVVLVGLTAARWRLPAFVWALPPAIALILPAVVGLSNAVPATAWLSDANPTEIPQIAMAAEATRLAPRALGFFWAALWCGLSAVAAAAIRVLRLEHPQTTWLAGILPIASGTTAGLAALLVAILTAAPLMPVLTMVTLAGSCITAVALTAFQSSLSRTERTVLNTERAVVLTLGLGSMLALGLGWRDVLAVSAWAGSRDPNQLGFALTSTVLPTTATFVLAVAAAGLPALASAREGLFTARTVLSGLALAVLVAGTTAVLWVSGPDPVVHEAGLGGAVARIPDAMWTRLPRAIDPSDAEAPADAIDGSCLVTEAAKGWDAEPLFVAITPAAHVARSVPDPSAVHELDRAPGCPPAKGPLDGPLASSEIAIVALDASRAAAALTGQDWFRQAGSLRVLVQPNPRVTEAWSSAATRRLASAVPFLWQVPPQMTQPEGFEPGIWDHDYAATLPVTLFEGPYPVLVAGGMRSRLPAGAVGQETLQLVLSAQPSHLRDLVIIPRKTWTVQDIVTYCLAVHDHVEGARCVVYNETPIKWSLRTGLPLPW